MDSRLCLRIHSYELYVYTNCANWHTILAELCPLNPFLKIICLIQEGSFAPLASRYMRLSICKKVQTCRRKRKVLISKPGLVQKGLPPASNVQKSRSELDTLGRGTGRIRLLPRLYRGSCKLNPNKEASAEPLRTRWPSFNSLCSYLNKARDL